MAAIGSGGGLAKEGREGGGGYSVDRPAGQSLADRRRMLEAVAGTGRRRRSRQGPCGPPRSGSPAPWCKSSSPSVGADRRGRRAGPPPGAPSRSRPSSASAASSSGASSGSIGSPKRSRASLTPGAGRQFGKAVEPVALALAMQPDEGGQARGIVERGRGGSEPVLTLALHAQGGGKGLAKQLAGSRRRRRRSSGRLHAVPGRSRR